MKCHLITVFQYLCLLWLVTADQGVPGIGMLNDKCKDDAWCMVTGGHCDSRMQKCMCRNGYVRKNHFKCIKSSRIGEVCLLDKQCQIRDPNSHCIAAHDGHFALTYKCMCKKRYRIEIINGTDHCVNNNNHVSSYDDTDIDDLTAAPIILCFITCIVVEIFCLLGFRYWKKHRMQSEFRRHEMNLERGTVSRLEAVRRAAPIPVVTFSILHPPNPVVSGIGPSSSPPPYSMQVTEDRIPVTSQGEEGPPSYEEAVKLTLLPPAFSESTSNQSGK